MVPIRRQLRHERQGYPQHPRGSCRGLGIAPPQQTGRRPQRAWAPARPQRRPDQGQGAPVLPTWEGGPLSEAAFHDALAAMGQGLAALDVSDRGLLSSALGGATGSDWPWQGDVGLRAATEAGGFDLALVGAWLASRVPLLTVDPDLRVLPAARWAAVEVVVRESCSHRRSRSRCGAGLPLSEHAALKRSGRART